MRASLKSTTESPNLLIMGSHLVSLVVVSLKLALSSTAEAGLTLERGRSCFSDTDLGRERKEEGKKGGG